MGIPLPALTIRPPQDPSEGISRFVQLKALLGQQQLLPGQLQQQKQQIHATDLENQQRAQTLADQKAMTAAMQDWDGKDMNELPSLILKRGGSATAVFGMKKNILDYQTQLSTLTKDQLANEKTKNDFFAQAIDNVKKLPPEQQPQAFENAKADAVQRGHLDPKQAQALQYQSPDQLDLLEKSLMGHSAATEQALKASQQAEAEQKTKQSAAETAKIQMETTGGMMTPAMAESKYRNIVMAQQLKRPVSDEDIAFKSAYEKQKELVPAFNFSLQNQGAGGANGQPSEMAKAIANGQMKWSEAVSPRTPISVKADLLRQVTSINPNFKSYDYDVEKKVEEKYTSGNVADQLLAIGTAREHMKTFSKLADALDNNNVQLLNKLGNEFGIQFGSDKTTNFRIAQEAFGGEVGKAFDGAGVVAAERADARKAYNDQMSKGQFKGAVQTVDELLAGKQTAAKKAYEAGKQGKPNFGEGTATGMTRIKASDGSLHDIPTDKLDAAKKIDPKLQVVQ